MNLTRIFCLVLFCGESYANCDDLISSMNDGASIRDAMICLNQLQKDLSMREGKDTLPARAVVAFNSEACPSGWNPLSNGEGRVIVGSGRGDGLSAHVLRDVGGAETHTLAVAQMPTHSHPYVDDGVYHNPPNKYEGLLTEFRGSSSVGLTHGAKKTTDTGGGQPHNNMQPFIVLKFCEKQ